MPETDEDGRHIIPLHDTTRVKVVNGTIAALSQLELFQRGGGLVDIVRDPENGEGDVVLPTGEPRVRVTPFLRVHELATMACCFKARRKNDAGGFSIVEVDPPNAVIRTLMDRGEWAHIRPLDAMVSWPVLRPDGSVFDGQGYDVRTRCYSTARTGITVPPCITPDHVAQAVATLNDIVAEFPFERPEHRSAWLSGLLSVLARPAIKGPIPMVIMDANDRGSGKTLLCDTIGAILSGQKLPRRGVPDSEEEWGKVMLGIGIGAYPVVLLDNVTGTLRSSTLDMVLTGEVYQGRVLGMNKEMRVPVRSQFMVSSNNATISTDLIRRSLHCRIVVQEERPEARTGFRYDLPTDAGKPEMRRKLLTAAFTILVGYEQAGRPRVDAAVPLGSYEAWSARVQSAIAWAGMPDPVATQAELREQADTEAEILGPLLSAWHGMYGSNPHTCSTVMNDLKEDESPAANALRDAIDGLISNGKRMDSTLLGYRIRKWQDKWLNGKRFFKGPESGGTRKWGVQAR